MTYPMPKWRTVLAAAVTTGKKWPIFRPWHSLRVWQRLARSASTAWSTSSTSVSDRSKTWSDLAVRAKVRSQRHGPWFWFWMSASERFRVTKFLHSNRHSSQPTAWHEFNLSCLLDINIKNIVLRLIQVEENHFFCKLSEVIMHNFKRGDIL